MTGLLYVKARAGELVKRIAWRLGRRSATEGAGQERGIEGEASRDAKAKRVERELAQSFSAQKA